ncbi:MAG: CvpA family protein [Clostridia bacterium]|nr:CvpA family protein [Clostridia bacterium]
MIYGLNAAWACWTVDILAVVVIIGFAALAAKRGFVDCIFSLITTVAAFLVAILLMKSVLRWTDGLFGLQELLENGCAAALGKIKALNVDVSNEGLQAMLEEQNIPAFLANFVVESVGDSEIPAGTTLATVIGGPLGRFITSLIAFFVLFTVAKLLLLLIKKLVSSFVNSMPVISSANRLLGFAVGLVQGVLVISAVVAVLSVIPVDGINRFFSECLLLKALYNHNPINMIIGWIIV